MPAGAPAGRSHLIISAKPRLGASSPAVLPSPLKGALRRLGFGVMKSKTLASEPTFLPTPTISFPARQLHPAPLPNTQTPHLPFGPAAAARARMRITRYGIRIYTRYLTYTRTHGVGSGFQPWSSHALCDPRQGTWRLCLSRCRCVILQSRSRRASFTRPSTTFTGCLSPPATLRHDSNCSLQLRDEQGRVLPR
jgi:hypothetical protein